MSRISHINTTTVKRLFSGLLLACFVLTAIVPLGAKVSAADVGDEILVTVNTAKLAGGGDYTGTLAAGCDFFVIYDLNTFEYVSNSLTALQNLTASESNQYFISDTTFTSSQNPTMENKTGTRVNIDPDNKTGDIFTIKLKIKAGATPGDYDIQAYTKIGRSNEGYITVTPASITVEGDSGGGVTPAYDTAYGTITGIADDKFTVTANTGYAIDVLTVDGTDDAAAHGETEYETPTAPATSLFASFERTLSIGANGTVKVVNRNSAVVDIALADGAIVYADDILEITPAGDYEVGATTGLNAVSGNTYNAASTQTTLLSVAFAPASLVNSGHGHGGTITNEGSSYTVTANANFAIDKLWVNGAEVSGAHGQTTWTGTPTASIFATFAHTVNFT
jgi:hypothetical protein